MTASTGFCIISLGLTAGNALTTSCAASREQASKSEVYGLTVAVTNQVK
jgi:hypothetical protein